MENVRRLIREHAAVGVVDSGGTIQPLEDWNPHGWSLISKAEVLAFAGSRYDRPQFESLLDNLLTKPGTAFRMILPDDDSPNKRD